MSSTMLRSLSRAAPSSTSLRIRSNRLQIQSSQVPAATCLLQSRRGQRRHAGIHAISNPTLAGIEKRWEEMPPQEQADLWMALRDRMKTDWHEMTLQEKKAAYWIAFGPYGPRALPPPGQNKEVFWYTVLGVGIAAVLFAISRQLARPAPKTMNAQYQAMTNEYLKVGMRCFSFVKNALLTRPHRAKKQNRSRVFHQKATKARG
ncbi:MAG: hypothetical protein LQ348_007568 [Seirophora lacunosa]|nr:MAG: hypothetical protein LQ348_007568 [Seirophora lacunosa]